MRKIRQKSGGFTLVEMMVSLAVLSLLIAAVVMLMMNAQTGAFVQQNKLDAYQEAREFVDQMSRDLRDAGYPNRRNYAVSDAQKYQISPTPGTLLQYSAVGLVKVDAGDLWFEGDVDGTGQVSVIRYHWDDSGANCPCLRRSQLPKISGDALTGQSEPVYQIEVQNVLNGTTSYPMSTTPVFQAFNGTAPIALPVDITNNPDAISQITNIKVSLTVQSRYKEPTTKQQPIMTLVSTVRINNCSIATDNNPMSC